MTLPPVVIRPAMKRVPECGDVELTNNLSEQMMRGIKMNLKNIFEKCKINKSIVADYLMSLLDKLKLSHEGDDLTGLLPCNLAT